MTGQLLCNNSNIEENYYHTPLALLALIYRALPTLHRCETYLFSLLLAFSLTKGKYLSVNFTPSLIHMSPTCSSVSQCLLSPRLHVTHPPSMPPHPPSTHSHVPFMCNVLRLPS